MQSSVQFCIEDLTNQQRTTCYEMQNFSNGPPIAALLVQVGNRLVRIHTNTKLVVLDLGFIQLECDRLSV